MRTRRPYREILEDIAFQLCAIAAALERRGEEAQRAPAPEERGAAGDGWLQAGIDSILSYQAGKRREDRQ